MKKKSALVVGAFVVLGVMLVTGAESEGCVRRPFVRLRCAIRGALAPIGCQSRKPNECRKCTTPSSDCGQGDPVVPVQSSDSPKTATPSSPQQSTVLDPVPGTGSKFGIGPKIPEELKIKLDPETLKKIESIIADSSQKLPSARIALQTDPAISARFERVLMALELLAWLGGIWGTGTLGGRLLPLVARLVSGQQSHAMGQSSQSATGSTVGPQQSAIPSGPVTPAGR